MFFVSATEILLSDKFTLLTILDSISCGLFESVSLLIPCLFLPKRINKIYAVILLTVYELSLIIALISYGFYGKVMVSEVCVLFLETNLNEIIEFVTGYLQHVNILNIVFSIVSVIFIVHIAVYVVSFFIRNKIRILIKWVTCIYFFLILLVPYHHYIYANSVPLQIKSVLNTRINLSEYIKDANLERKRVGRPDNIVLIIGESHNKNHSSLYGYNIRNLFNSSSIYIMPMVNPDAINLVTGSLPTNSFAYERALSIANNFPSIPFPSGWKANINGVDFSNFQYTLLINRLDWRLLCLIILFLKFLHILFFHYLLIYYHLLYLND